MLGSVQVSSAARLDRFAAKMMTIALAALLVASLAPTAAPSSRQARNLIFTPTGAKIQLIMGFGIPVDLPHQAVTMGYVIKSNYLTPFNSTQYTRPLDAFAQRSARGLRAAPTEGTQGATSATQQSTRWHLYNTLQLAIEQMGAGKGSGRQCLLRAVCEAAAFSVRHDGLLGELLHVMLTPSSTREPVLRHEDYEFHAAERAGRTARGAQDPVDICHRLFSGCATRTLDLFSRMLPFSQ